MEQEKKDECTIARPFYEKGNPNESREVVLQEKQHSMSESVTQELPSQMDHRRDFLEGGYLDVVNEEIFEVRSEKNCNRNASATEGKDFLLQSKKSDLLENAALRDRGQHDSVHKVAGMISWTVLAVTKTAVMNAVTQVKPARTFGKIKI